MAKVKTTTLLLTVIAALWAGPPASALTPMEGSPAPASARSPRVALDCPGCKRPMVWKWVKINGIWVKRYFCPEPTCN